MELRCTVCSRGISRILFGRSPDECAFHGEFRRQRIVHVVTAQQSHDLNLLARLTVLLRRCSALWGRPSHVSSTGQVKVFARPLALCEIYLRYGTCVARSCALCFASSVLYIHKLENSTVLTIDRIVTGATLSGCFYLLTVLTVCSTVL